MKLLGLFGRRVPAANRDAQNSEVFERRVHYGPLWDESLQEASAAGREPVAVLVCHGMGQQVRYETISAVANEIFNEAERRGGFVDPINVRLCTFGDDFLARAEVSWRDLNNRAHSAHVYEAYWAPLTEGRVTYWDTIRFLMGAAWNGFWHSLPFTPCPFWRWMFGGKRKLWVGPMTWFGIVCVFLFVLLQVAIIAYVGFELAQQVKEVIPQLPQFGGKDFLKSCLYALAPLFPGIKDILHPSSTELRWTAIRHLLEWFLLIVEALVVRYFIVEFVGDVAAYISPYKDSKFDEIRHQIQQIGLHVGKILYGFEEATTSLVPEYGKIIVVGHSLGSVLAYDTLNALINLDTAAPPGQNREVAIRTKALITFGSPLDKTAFIFRMQAKNRQDWIREQLAASVQPLIVDYNFRPNGFRWMNIWSPMDIISGSLDYYDDPAIPRTDPRRVHNEIDWRAWKPLGAHVQYWKNPLLRRRLYECLI